MSLRILGAGRYDGSDLEPLLQQADFRRATRNQIYAHIAVTEALKGISLEALLPDLGLVVASGHGELQVTKAFLSELGKNNVARPILFQNSLHNATLGFLTKAFNITGPALTVSNLFVSGENAMEAAAILIRGEVVKHCLIVGVDVLVPELGAAMQALYPPGTQLGEGAAALLLSGTSAASSSISDWEFGVGSAELMTGYYDADAIELVAKRVIGRTAGEIRLKKPDGAFSRCNLEFT